MSKKPSQRPRIQEVAEAAGVSRATVSMALNGRPGVNERTRERVRAVAAELGYFVHPVLAGLAALKFSRSDLVKGAVLVRSRESRHLDFAKSQARELTAAGKPYGFTFEVVDSTRFSRPSALTKSLYDRGFLVVFISYIPWDADFLSRVDWKHFACVRFTGEPMQPEFHLVRVSHFQLALRACDSLLRTDARRIGPLLIRPTPERKDFMRHAASVHWKLWEEQPGRATETCYLDSFDEREKNRETIRRWMAKEEPDAILAVNRAPVEFVLEARPAFPRERIVLLQGAGDGFSGYRVGFSRVARESLVLLNSLCRGSQFGPPAKALEILVEPEFVDAGG